MKSLFSPIILTVGLLLTLPCLCILALEVDYLKEYWESERIYNAAAEQIDPALEGKLIRVVGELTTKDLLTPEGSTTGVNAILTTKQHGFTHAIAAGLQLGVRQVVGMNNMPRQPFGYLGHSDMIVKEEGKDGYLPSGTTVCLIGRQKGNTIDMADEAANAGFTRSHHTRALRHHDISLESFTAFSVIVLFIYYLLWWGVVSVCRETYFRKRSSFVLGVTSGSCVLCLISLCVLLC